MGTIVEDIITPNIPTIAKKYFNCDKIDHLMVRTYKRTPDRTKGKEFDVIAIFGNKIILNDTKSTPTIQYIDKFIHELENNVLFDYFPEYSGKEIIPIFSSLSIREDLVKYLTKNKIFALAMTGTSMDLLNADSLLGVDN